eukprot:scaffold876_cov243-Pinguiococcus_pyrenoidosus.AAC.1
MRPAVLSEALKARRGDEKRQAKGASKKKRLTLEEKGAILDLLADAKETTASLAKKFKVGERTVFRIKSEREKIESALLKCGSSTALRKSKGQFKPKFPAVEELSLQYFEDIRRARLPVTLDTIQAIGRNAKAKVLKKIQADDSHASEIDRLQQFSVSQKWARAFIKRHNLQSQSLFGEAGSVDPASESILTGMEAVRRKCSEYSLDRIFNVDETGLFYKLLPKRSYLGETEDRKTARGTKEMKAKDRITALICTSADGSKVKLCVIGKSKNPRCFRKKSPPIKYLSQPRAWSDQKIFMRWFREVFVPHIRRITSEPVLLLLDNCSGHGSLLDPRGQIEVLELPPNCTSVLFD